MLDLADATLLQTSCRIGSRRIMASDALGIPVRNPATGACIASVPRLGAAATRDAVVAAEVALPDWRARSAKQRSVLLHRWYELVIATQEDLARILTAEQGKPLAEARGEIAYAASFIEWFAEEGKRLDGQVLQHPQPDQRILVLRQPVGVTAAITPWNFPAAMITRKVAPALAAGCTMVLKPASQTPLTALALAELASRAGIPDGVLNVVTGSAAEIGDELANNPVVRKLSFTGSTAVGRTLMAKCAGTIKKLSLELGGNAPFIVFDDADLDAAVAGLMQAKFRNAGQTCVCANRIYVQDAVYERFAEELARAMQALQLGNGMDAGITQGPLIDEAAVRKVEEHIADALAQGAQLRVGGQRHALGGTFFQPTLLTGVNAGMLIAREETFGPVAPLFRFQDETEVIRQANASEFGLAAYFYSRDFARIFRVAEALESGMVGVNTGLISNEVGPFGGIKQSGLGREGSRFGIDEYVELKYLCLGGL
ncbi:NAD-dependent succinate-semialdehyde dehydrogenase [Chitinilyticum piscinae]|uniref:NAD-dependent succinate-semialdehyde dehydrogenase n=1 Tax=Chitinilyticum piscinae TaxID=2866724 RepID=A0A8J7K1B7_9NEIS|nr:NAD-dependent succinate-semialdehyde dehydrogenase [Chitinilyticum piscinae]MBE9608452.1 NAD-dependent succinate-semialdehyde dehydrogenase [Chitinilyticum piscinae]